MNVQTRHANADDVTFARLAHHAAYRDVVERQFGPWIEARQDDFFAADWSAHPAEIIVADGIACGYWIVEERADEIHLRELVIHPQWQSRGIGRLLLVQLQSRAVARDVPIRLGTLTQNRAKALYERLGFRILDRTSTHLVMEWQPQMTPAR